MHLLADVQKCITQGNDRSQERQECNLNLDKKVRERSIRTDHVG